MFIIALSLLFYPIIVNYFVAQQNKVTIQKYNQSLGKLDTEKIKQLMVDAQRYNQYIYTKSQYKVWNQSVPDYNKQLISDGSKVIASLSIPQIKVDDVPVYSGDSESTLAVGIGHIPQTSLPIGGVNTHAVLSAHSGHVNNTLFSDLEYLKKGDAFYIHVLGKTLKYEIFDRKIVAPEDTSSINVVTGKDLVTLVTCWPTGINNKRLLVTGTRIPNGIIKPQEHVQRNKYGYNFWVMGVASLLALIAIGLIFRNLFANKKHIIRVDRMQFDAIQEGNQRILIVTLKDSVANKASKKYRKKEKLTLIAGEEVFSKDETDVPNKQLQYFSKRENKTWGKVSNRKQAEKQRAKIIQIVSSFEFNTYKTREDKTHSETLLSTTFMEEAAQVIRDRLGSSILPEKNILLEIVAEK